MVSDTAGAPFLYELHLHTRQGSACGKSGGAEHVRYYQSIGFTGIFITDHFLRGNTAVPHGLPWKNRIDLFRKGYEDAWNEGQKCGLDVFFAWEETFEGDDYLIYGPSPEWLVEHPEAEHWTYREQYEAVHEAGGCVVQAHPFRCRNYINRIILNKEYVDAVEVANAGNRQIEDAAAKRYAQEYGFYEICGSDNHNSTEGKFENGQIYGIGTSRRLGSAFDLARLILRKEPIKLFAPRERYDLTDETIPLESFWIDKNEKRTPTGRSWI